MCAGYLFQQDKFYDLQYDTGDKVIQCGRHNDIFKLWLQWRAKVGNFVLKHKFWAPIIRGPTWQTQTYEMQNQYLDDAEALHSP